MAPAIFEFIRESIAAWIFSLFSRLVGRKQTRLNETWQISEIVYSLVLFSLSATVTCSSDVLVM